MSHSAFNLSANESCVNNRNLVIVVKKDGTLAADQEALQELLVSKGNPNTAISLLRETSPTPSITQEIEDERKQKMLYLREQYLAEHNDDEEIDEDELEQKLLEATADDTEIPHVTLSVESFYPADQARKFVNDVLHLGGIRDPKMLLPVDFHYQRMIIQNDHCYTPLTRTSAPESTELPHPKIKEKIVGVIKQQKPAKVRQPIAESEDSETGEAIGEDEEDIEDENSSEEAISFSESDDEDDLDFSVNDRFGTKKPRKIKSGRNKSSRRNKTRNSNSSSFKDLIDGEMETMFQEAEPVPVKPNVVQVVTKKKYIKSPKKTQVRPSTSTGIKNMTNVVIIKPEKPLPTNTQSVAQAVKKIQQQLQMTSKSNIQKLPDGVKKVIYPDMSTHLSHPIKEFVPLTANLLKNNNLSQFPGHISIQTHPSSEMEFVESMVNDLEKNFPSPEKKMSVIAGPSNPSVIPNIVQMLETSTPAEMIDQSLSSLEHTIMDTVAGTDPNFEGIEDALFAALGNEVLEELFDKVQESGELMNFTPNAVPMRNNMNSSEMLSTNNLIINESRPTTSTLLQSPPVKILNSKGNNKDPIKYIRNGRIITLPPIEAPTTRGAKRRAQGSTSELNVSTSSLNTSQLSTKMPKLEKTPSVKDPDSRNSSRRSSLNKSESSRGSRRQSGALGIVAAVAAGLPQAVGNDEEMDDLGSDETWNSEDDPDRLWCICKQPHNNRFMICCDKCVDWFHGKCVNITKSMGREMEELGIEWRCPNCKQNKGSGESTPIGKKQQPTKKQQKLTKFFKNKGTKDEDNVQMCLVCKEQPARSSSIYCSDDCIRNHASKHGGEEEEEKEKEKVKEVVPLKRGNVLKDKSGNVVVYDRISGRVLSMAKSPHASVLSQWLAAHPTFEPVKPGSPQADMVLNRPKIVPPVAPQELSISATTQSKDELFSNPVKIVTGIASTSPVKKPANQAQPVRIVQVSNTSRSVQGIKVGTSIPSNKLPVKAPVKASLNASGSSKFKVEQERLNVRNILKETLAQRMTEFEHPDIQKMTDDEITEFSRATEREMFLYFSKDTREKYKIKFRSLKFNLGDTKNRTLLERICSKMLSPKQLVELPPSALASEELAKWRDNETKHQLEIITKSELDALAQTQVHVVKTHKGEEIIETKSDLLGITTVLPSNLDDVESIINSSALSTEDSILSPQLLAHKDRYDISKSIAVSAQISSSPLSSPSVTSSTGAKKSDSRVRSRSRSKSKGKDHHSHHHSSSSSHHHKSSSSSAKHKKSERHRSKSRDKKDVKKPTSNREREDKERKSREEKRKSSDVKEVIKKELPKDQKPKVVKKPVVKVEVDLVGEILGAMGANIDKPIKKEEPVKKVEKQEEKLPTIPAVNRMEVPPLIFHEPLILSTDPNVEIEIYSGNLFMNDVAKFNVTACSVSGFVEDVIKELSSQLEVVGRIMPAAVWEYLENIMKFPGKEIAIIRFASTDDANYTALYSYLHSRDRVGVIRVESTKIKDLYLVPVQGGNPLPKVLLPLKGPGFIEGDQLRPDMLIGVIVKVLPVLKVRRPVKKVPSSQKHSRSSSLQLIQSLPPIKSSKPSKLTMNLPNAEQLLKASSSQKALDDEEPYTPFDDDSSTPPPQYIATTSNANNKLNTSDDYEIAQLEKQIAKKQMEKRQLINQIPDGAYENIELPSNLTEILSRFQNSSTAPVSGGGDNVGMSIDDDDDDDDDEYVPTAMTGMRNVEYRPNAPMMVIPPPTYNPQSSLMDIDERIFQQIPPQQVAEESKLSTMSEADLMKLVPDGMDLDPPPMTSNVNKQPAIPGLDVYDAMDE